MMGVWVFRLVDDKGVFTIAGSSIRDPIGSSSAVVKRAASTVVLSSYVRTIGVRVMTRLPSRLVHQGAFVSIGTIKSETNRAVWVMASKLVQYKKEVMKFGRYTTTQNIIRCTVMVPFADGST
jgi:hypothetical protein